MTDQTPSPASTPPTAGRRRGRRTIAAVAVLGLAAGAVAIGAWSRTADADPAPSALENRLQTLVDAGYPGVLASVTAPDGTRTDVTLGEGDITTGDSPPMDGEIRIASNTKMFTATIVMQLVEEGTVSLDEPVDTYLPGLITGDGIDGTVITVRQLLQHTSGLPEYADQIAADAFGAQETYISPRDMLDVALDRPAVFASGSTWEYSNTNYLALGLLIERVTERALPHQVDERIVEPLGLEHTYFPQPGETELRGEHPQGYHADVPGELRPITDMDTSFAWAAGAIVSTPSELNTVMQAILGSDLVSAESLAAMQDAVPAGNELAEGTAYGLGLESHPLSCGGIAWGHGGDIPGTQTRNAVGPDGTAVTIAVTSLPWAVVDPADDEKLTEQYRIVIDALDETLCEK
ncbi:serine hydrolase domain-containing protein [Labedella endophytica]|uniref:Class A beta-lactamase-related serine hydrolase n=1 Tax=Labedella endophytica TaxID=1523160 RepID=A0A433JNB8_9MICO|nr:serine hydrolase domain-containing protein [Labedella endophytica]RUQ97616.1 class A beta-lactamase-related serine hydrolase [Labedella endophytica]